MGGTQLSLCREKVDVFIKGKSASLKSSGQVTESSQENNNQKPWFGGGVKEWESISGAATIIYLKYPVSSKNFEASKQQPSVTHSQPGNGNRIRLR